MDINKVAEKLLELHCHGCDGERYGCRGCSRREEILTILKEYTANKE
jgi:hypothetical protein